MDFADLKTIKVVEVLGERYKVKLQYRGDYASGLCPLPTHKQGDRDKSFAVHIPSNTWRCFSKSCGNERPSDVITLVRVMEGLVRPLEAAQKLSEWYKKSAPLPERKVREATTSPPSPHTEHTSPSDNGKGYIKAVDAWFDELFELLDEMKANDYWKKCRNGVKSKLIESYKNGKAAR